MPAAASARAVAAPMPGDAPVTTPTRSASGCDHATPLTRPAAARAPRPRSAGSSARRVGQASAQRQTRARLRPPGGRRRRARRAGGRRARAAPSREPGERLEAIAVARPRRDTRRRPTATYGAEPPRGQALDRPAESGQHVERALHQEVEVGGVVHVAERVELGPAHAVGAAAGLGAAGRAPPGRARRARRSTRHAEARLHLVGDAARTAGGRVDEHPVGDRRERRRRRPRRAS